MFKQILILATSIIFISCGGGGGGSDEEPNIMEEYSGDTTVTYKKIPSTIINDINISTWMYQIQDLFVGDNLDILDNTNYDMLVVEPSMNIKDEHYDTAKLVSTLSTKPNGDKRLLIAYVDIGQAEDYRDYWKDNWVAPTKNSKGYPDFMITIDPDGWSGNYPVAYWDKRWKDIWLGDDGIIAKLATEGFDGIYLDWIEAYDEDRVLEYAKSQNIDAKREMIKFMKELKEKGQEINPNFVVIAQNAQYLLDYAPTEYASIIDAIATEDTWFYGDGDANWNDSRAGDLHGDERHQDEFSTENRIKQNSKYLKLGIPVFTVDYCISEKNANYVYNQSRVNGFIHIVTRVSLSKLTTTPPTEFLATKSSSSAVKITNSYLKSSQNPCFSPNGKSIIYTRFLNGYNKGPSEIVKINIDGTNEQIIVPTIDSDNVSVPFGAWVGNKICFASDRGGEADEIWIADDNGDNLQKITTHSEDNEVYYIEPVFNPKDNTQIVFEYVKGEDDKTAIHKIAFLDTKTKEVTLLTDGTYDDRLPSWSNDGTKILFQRNNYGADEGWEIYTANINTTKKASLSNFKLITFGEADYTDCSWSYNDKYILSSSNYNSLDVPNIWMFPTDLSLTPIQKSFNKENEDGAPTQSHDGKSIAFESHSGDSEEEPSEIWIVN